MIKKYTYILLLATIVSGCSKTMQLDPLDFEVSVVNETVKAGEEVTFNFTGDANIVSFYSGVLGNDYQYSDGRSLELIDPQVSFTSSANYGNQEGQLSVLVSTEFNGDISPAGIQASVDAGQWIDITNEFAYSSSKSTSGSRLYNGVAKASGVFNLSNIITSEKKGIYFAYRNITTNAGLPTQWTMSRFLVTANTILGRQTIAAQNSADWKLSILATPGQSNVGNNPNSSVWFPRNPDRSAVVHNWIITKKIEFSDQDLGPDLSTPIKSYMDPQLTEFKYTYDVPGIYIASFFASNVNAEGEKKVIKQVKIVVEEP